ncbi:MAG TPA: hypothetical protein VEU74_12085 [Gemmatimonadales bacterium]|nr:hypothetical protein [Gemmatimonadales bacterium]
MPGKPGHFGPAVIGQEAFEREQAERAKGADVFGPAVISDAGPSKPTPEQLRAQPGLAKLHGMEPKAPESKPAVAQLSVEKLKEALEDNPFILDGMIAAEFERPGGPRKPALRLLLKVEQAKAEPRPEVVARLSEPLKPKPEPVAAEA